MATRDAPAQANLERGTLVGGMDALVSATRLWPRRRGRDQPHFRIPDPGNCGAVGMERGSGLSRVKRE